MNKSETKKLLESIARGLQHFEFITFAILFGSFANDKITDVSDIDIGIYTGRNIDLLEIGILVSRLERILKRKIDVLILNDLFKQKPVIAFNVVSKGQLIICKDPIRFIEFKKNTFLYYLDTIPLREKINKEFKKRLVSGHFGDRNYVGTA